MYPELSVKSTWILYHFGIGILILSEKLGRMAKHLELDLVEPLDPVASRVSTLKNQNRYNMYVSTYKPVINNLHTSLNVHFLFNKSVQNFTGLK